MKAEGKGEAPDGRNVRETGDARFLQTMRAVFWSFFGVRKRADYERDVQRLDPRHVLAAGLIGAALFVLVLVLLVKWVVGSGVAAG